MCPFRDGYHTRYSPYAGMPPSLPALSPSLCLTMPDPCHDCGLCCQHFRISFYHGELDSQPGGYVPADLVSQLTPFRACMRGTESGGGRCIALDDRGRCGIYAQRPSVCRDFPALLPDGQRNPACVSLRAQHGKPAEACESNPFPGRRTEVQPTSPPIPLTRATGVCYPTTQERM